MSQIKAALRRPVSAPTSIPTFENLAVLSERDHENFMRAVEFSLAIRKRYQFFVWSQNYLQPLLPHELLFCAYGEYRQRVYTTVRFSTLPFDDKELADVADPQTGLLTSAIDAWIERGKDPLLICPQSKSGDLYARFCAMLESHSLLNLALHGIQHTPGGFGVFVGFSRMPCALSPRHAYLIELILPHLHTTVLRMLALDDSSSADKPVPAHQQAVVTAREIQILRWVRDGKKNREIGAVLNISALTVKNHVQNILRKLNAQNRTQAVSRALALKLLS